MPKITIDKKHIIYIYYKRKSWPIFVNRESTLKNSYFCLKYNVKTAICENGNNYLKK